MTAKRDFNASITTKGLDKTGITEEVARKLYSRRGRKFMGVVEFVVDETSDKRDGTHKVSIGISDLEILLDDSTFEEHLREIMKTLSYNRALDDDQPPLPGDGINPKLEDVLEAGVRHRPHPFLPVDAADDNGICDICGVVFTAGPHTTEGFLPTDGEEDGETEQQEQGAESGETEEETGPDVDALTDEPAEADVETPQPDPYDFVHAKGGSLPGEETVCALHATSGKNLHTHDDREHVTCPDCIEQLDIDASFHADDTGGPSTTDERHLSAVADPFAAPATT